MSDHSIYEKTVAQVAALLVKRDQLRQSVADYKLAADDNLVAVRLALADNERLRTALAEYANKENWNFDLWLPNENGWTGAQAALTGKEARK